MENVSKPANKQIFLFPKVLVNMSKYMMKEPKILVNGLVNGKQANLNILKRGNYVKVQDGQAKSAREWFMST